MLSFLRHLRQKLLEENRLNKYLLYVFIEVFIVIIGILIAIRADNWNEARIDAKNTKLLFKEVSDELVQNIKNIDRIINLYIEKDSIYFKVLNRMVSYEDYKEYPRLFHIAFTSDMTNIMNPLSTERTGLVDEDFKELLTGKNNLTEQQDSLFSELKDLYGKRKKIVDMDDETIYSTQLNFKDKMMNEHSWWSDYVTTSMITDEIINYALSDPFYLNQLSEMRSREHSHTLGMLWFRTKALALHMKIADMLNTDTDTSFVRDMADFEHIKGYYHWEGGSLGFDIRGEHELRSSLYFNDSMVDDRGLIYPYYKSHLIIYEETKAENWLAKIEYGKDGEVLGLTWFGNMGVENGKRIMSKKIE
jgi:hypothetical protein